MNLASTLITVWFLFFISVSALANQSKGYEDSNYLVCGDPNTDGSILDFSFCRLAEHQCNFVRRYHKSNSEHLYDYKSYSRVEVHFPSDPEILDINVGFDPVEYVRTDGRVAQLLDKARKVLKTCNFNASDMTNVFQTHPAERLAIAGTFAISSEARRWVQEASIDFNVVVKPLGLWNYLSPLHSLADAAAWTSTDFKSIFRSFIARKDIDLNFEGGPEARLDHVLYRVLGSPEAITILAEQSSRIQLPKKNSDNKTLAEVIFDKTWPRSILALLAAWPAMPINPPFDAQTDLLTWLGRALRFENQNERIEFLEFFKHTTANVNSLDKYGNGIIHSLARSKELTLEFLNTLKAARPEFNLFLPSAHGETLFSLSPQSELFQSLLSNPIDKANVKEIKLGDTHANKAIVVLGGADDSIFRANYNWNQKMLNLFRLRAANDWKEELKWQELIALTSANDTHEFETDLKNRRLYYLFRSGPSEVEFKVLELDTLQSRSIARYRANTARLRILDGRYVAMSTALKDEKPSHYIFENSQVLTLLGQCESSNTWAIMAASTRGALVVGPQNRPVVCDFSNGQILALSGTIEAGIYGAAFASESGFYFSEKGPNPTLKEDVGLIEFRWSDQAVREVAHGQNFVRSERDPNLIHYVKGTHPRDVHIFNIKESVNTSLNVPHTFLGTGLSHLSKIRADLSSEGYFAVAHVEKPVLVRLTNKKAEILFRYSKISESLNGQPDYLVSQDGSTIYPFIKETYNRFYNVAVVDRLSKAWGPIGTIGKELEFGDGTAYSGNAGKIYWAWGQLGPAFLFRFLRN